MFFHLDPSGGDKAKTVPFPQACQLIALKLAHAVHYFLELMPCFGEKKPGKWLFTA